MGDEPCGLDIEYYAMQSELARLTDENAELRYKVHVLEGGNKGLQILNDSLKANNVKLRELIRTVWLAGDFRAFLGADEIKGRMRELGIEVEE